MIDKAIVYRESRVRLLIVQALHIENPSIDNNNKPNNGTSFLSAHHPVDGITILGKSRSCG